MPSRAISATRAETVWTYIAPGQKAVEPEVGIEPTTYRLQGGCSTTELHRPVLAAILVPPPRPHTLGTMPQSIVATGGVRPGEPV